MEKMKEINIEAKSHMSLVDDDQIDRLYKHIGVVNRTLVSGSDEGTNTEPAEKQESQLVRKSIPRIIRKTEIIIHDDDYSADANKEKKKKGRKNYVRTSSSTDGLMSGLQRGNDDVISSNKKQNVAAGGNTKKEQSDSKKSADPQKAKEKKVETVQKKEKKVTPNVSDDGIVGISPRSDRVRKPVDNILSIKKVASKEEWEKRSLTDDVDENKEIETEVKPEDKAASKAKEPVDVKKEQEAKEEDNSKIMVETKKNTKDSIIDGIQKETVPAEAEKKEEYMQRDMQKTNIQQTQEDATSEKKAVQKDKEETTAKVSEKVRKAEQAGSQDKEPAKSIPTQGANQKKSNVVGAPGQDIKKTQKRSDRPAQGSNKDQQVRPSRQPASQPRRSGEMQKKRSDFNQNKDRFPRQNEYGVAGKSNVRQDAANKPLVIPKANLAPGQVEEKTNIRGERRSAAAEKGFKRDAKKEQPKKGAPKFSTTSVGAKDKPKHRRTLPVGHTANVSDMYSDEFILNEFYAEKVKPKRERPKRKEKHIPPKAVLTEITIPEVVTVKNLAESLKKTSAEVIKKLMKLGVMATLNQELDFDTAVIIGDEFGIAVKKEVVVSDEDILFDEQEDSPEELVDRAPVVVVMGHVDHGKTSLLDAIRKTRVADKEAGGITQHIGAYKVDVNGRSITFLDTPGHEAFTSMRARGAQSTDIAILVVAADDGVMPQTIEAINHAKAANISVIIAINKMDKSDANPDRIKQQLTEHGLVIEEWGGDIIAVPVSAKSGENIDQLLEMVILTADMLELKANPSRQAKGIVIEAKLDKGRGPVATVLVQRGTLYAGDSIISGTTFGRIRAMTDENGQKLENAGPSTPIEIIGLDEVPEAGDIFYSVSDEKTARHLISKRRSEQREQTIGAARTVVTLDDLFSKIQEGEVKDLNIIVKADVQGSVEAVKQSVERLSNEEVNVQVIHGGVGSINEADVTLASVSNAIIIGFNVRPPQNIIEAAQDAGVDLRLYRVIYSAIEDIEKAMKGLLDPEFKEVVDGHVDIRQTFKASSVGTIGGGYVTDGKINRNSDIRIVRDGIVVFEGKLASLKRFKDDVREVLQGYECGVLVDRFNDIKVGDVVEAFRMVEIERH